MKRILSICILILAFSMLLSPACFALDENIDTLADMDIEITVPENTTTALNGDEYFIYTKDPDSIPYVSLRVYCYDSLEDFIDAFTDYMYAEHHGLWVTKAATPITVGDKDCMEIEYWYTVGEFGNTERYIITMHNGLVYRFAAKEIQGRNLTVGTMLEDVVASARFLSEDGDNTRSGVFSAAYLYCQDDGLPKYWLDLSGTLADDPVLHCIFRSSDPTFYETWFTLDLATSVEQDDAIYFSKIVDSQGLDLSDQFKKLCLRFVDAAAILEVERDEATLAGGAEDNILTGEYRMAPIGEGPFTTKDLGKLSQLHYLRKTGSYLPNVEVEKVDAGTYSVHLFENDTAGDESDVDTSVWYSVDIFGFGVGAINNEVINLLPYVYL